MFGVVSCCCRIVIFYMLSRSGRKWSHTSFALSCYNDIIEGFPSMTIVSHFSFFFVYLLFLYFSRGFFFFFFVRVNRKSEVWCFVGGFFSIVPVGWESGGKERSVWVHRLCEEFLLLLSKTTSLQTNTKKKILKLVNFTSDYFQRYLPCFIGRRYLVSVFSIPLSYFANTLG